MDRIFKHPNLSFVECRYSTDSGRHYKPHMHKCFCVGAVDRGEVIYVVGGCSAKVRPGSLTLVNPETLHSCNPSGSRKRSYYMLFFDVDWCLLLQQSLWELDRFRPVTTTLLEDPSIYQQFLNVMVVLWEDGDLLEKEQLLVDLVGSIFIQACQPGAENDEPSAYMEQLKLRLGADLDENISLEQIAANLQANPYTLLRQFKTATGLTPHAYRLNCRVELAKKLLQEGMALSQVALACGFFDQSHFHRHFKDMTTMTPKAYQVNCMAS